MDARLPVAVGIGIIVAVIILAKVLPESWLRSELLRVYGARPTGAYDVMARRDILRRALYSAIGAALLVGSSFALFPVAEHWANESRPRLTFEALFFVTFLLSGVAALAAILSLISAAFWRPRRLTVTAERRTDLAQYLIGLSQGALCYEAWRDLSVVRFDDPATEALRREFARRIGPRPRALSDDDISWLRETADTLLAHAV
jgi:hypothetical protein